MRFAVRATGLGGYTGSGMDAVVRVGVRAAQPDSPTNPLIATAWARQTIRNNTGALIFTLVLWLLFQVLRYWVDLLVPRRTHIP